MTSFFFPILNILPLNWQWCTQHVLCESVHNYLEVYISSVLHASLLHFIPIWLQCQWLCAIDAAGWYLTGENLVPPQTGDVKGYNGTGRYWQTLDVALCLRDVIEMGAEDKKYEGLPNYRRSWVWQILGETNCGQSSVNISWEGVLERMICQYFCRLQIGCEHWGAMVYIGQRCYYIGKVI